MANLSLFDRINSIIHELEQTDMTKFAQADVENIEGEKSEHPTAKEDDGTQEHETGEQYDELSEMVEEYGGIDAEDDVESDADLGEMSENLPEGAVLAGEERPEQPKMTKDDDTEHPADASKSASFDRWLKHASIQESLVVGMKLVKQALAESDTLVKSANTITSGNQLVDLFLTNVKVAAEDTADMVAGALEKMAEAIEDASEQKSKEDQAVSDLTAATDMAESAGEELSPEELKALEQQIEKLLNTDVTPEEAKAIADAVQEASEEDKTPTEGDQQAKELLNQMAETPAAPVPPEVVGAEPAKIAMETAGALSELGLTTSDLAATGEVGYGLAKMAEDVVAISGQPGQPKRGSRERIIRDYMKNYIAELFRRSR